MTLDGTIGNMPIGIAFLVAFVVLGNWFERRWNPKPPPERYQRDPKQIAFVSFWNILDDKKWTEEGLVFHERRMLFSFCALIVFGGGWWLLDAIW